MARGTKRKAVQNSETKAKRARGETDLKNDLKWSYVGEASTSAPYIQPLLQLTSDTLPGCAKVAGFDIDFTLIEPKSGRKFATGAKDWKWLYPCVPDKLKELHNEGYRIVFFTNQAGIEKMKVKPEEIQRKVEDMLTQLDIPAYCFVTTGQNHFRKPSTATWDHFVKNWNGGISFLGHCIYIGDAAGRAKNWREGKPRDFSCGDRMFAANIGIDFKTPEEFFLGEPSVPFEWGPFDPEKYLRSVASQKDSSVYHSSEQEMVLMIGPPASGKSTFVKRHLIPNGYEHVNRDTLHTPAKCLKAAKEAIDAGKSVVVDNTNPSKHARAEFINIAKKKGIPVRCFNMSTKWELAQHLNYVRQTYTESKVRRVPDVGYNVYKKNFEAPDKSEGFAEIKNLDFVPWFDNKKHESVFRKWTSLV